MHSITKKTLARSALVGLFLTIEGMVFQTAKSSLILHLGPPRLGDVIGCTVCYLLAGFAFALGFFAFSERLPGRTWIGKGLRYSAVILVAVWISGFINLFAIDFEGGWRLFTPARIEDLWMAVADCLNFMIGGLVLGLIARKDGPAAPVLAPFTANLAARIGAGAVLLPNLCAGFFALVALLLPTGFDLSGERVKLFYVFLFVPLAVSGAGTALFHDALRIEPRTAAGTSGRTCLILFFAYWVPNVLFVLFLGFTWQTVVGFLVAMAAALYVTMLALETMARARPRVGLVPAGGVNGGSR